MQVSPGPASPASAGSVAVPRPVYAVKSHLPQAVIASSNEANAAYADQRGLLLALAHPAYGDESQRDNAERACGNALRALLDGWKSAPIDLEPRAALRRAMDAANAEVRSMLARGGAYGCACAAVLAKGDVVAVANVGLRNAYFVQSNGRAVPMVPDSPIRYLGASDNVSPQTEVKTLAGVDSIVLASRPVLEALQQPADVAVLVAGKANMNGIVNALLAAGAKAGGAGPASAVVYRRDGVPGFALPRGVLIGGVAAAALICLVATSAVVVSGVVNQPTPVPTHAASPIPSPAPGIESSTVPTRVPAQTETASAPALEATSTPKPTSTPVPPTLTPTRRPPTSTPTSTPPPTATATPMPPVPSGQDGDNQPPPSVLTPKP